MLGSLFGNWLGRKRGRYREPTRILIGDVDVLRLKGPVSMAEKNGHRSALRVRHDEIRDAVTIQITGHDGRRRRSRLEGKEGRAEEQA